MECGSDVSYGWSFLGTSVLYDKPGELYLLDALSGWLPDAANRKLETFSHTDQEKLSIPLFLRNSG